MDIEYEATFPNIDKNAIRNALKKIGAKRVHPEFLQKRVVFYLPKGHEIEGGWVRVRQEYDKITTSLKIVNGEKITDQKEACVTVNDFDQAVALLEGVGCIKKSYQENKREKWSYDEVEITINEWPFLESFVEVEGKSEDAVEKVSSLLCFDYAQAVFGSTDVLICKKYNVSPDKVNNHTPLIVFGGKNPYLEN